MLCATIVPEMINPSSPTPPHLRKLRLSFLDQLAPPTYIHIIFYFEAFQRNPDSSDTSRKLKQSLSDALATYYPLAGRLRDNSWVDCNDAGVEYSEALFHDDRILDVVENPRIEDLKQYVPAAPCGGGDIPLAVQVSFFGCTGAAIGVCISHRVADAMSMVTFVNAWAAICRGDAKTVASSHPTFDLASRFPPADFSKFFKPESPPPPPVVAAPPQKVVYKRFVFDKQKLVALRKAASGPTLQNPTRVQAISAFIWRHLIGEPAAENRVFAAAHVVDIRASASPPLPRQFFGNACARAMAMTTTATATAASGKQGNYYDLATKLRDAITKVDVEYVARLEKGDKFLEYYSSSEENDPVFKDGRKFLEYCLFTSWWRLPAYEADFGWGKPVWVSIVGVPVKNLIFFLGTKSGDGIEVWVSLVEEDLAIIETSYNLLDDQLVEETVEAQI